MIISSTVSLRSTSIRFSKKKKGYIKTPNTESDVMHYMYIRRRNPWIKWMVIAPSRYNWRHTAPWKEKHTSGVLPSSRWYSAIFKSQGFQDLREVTMYEWLLEDITKNYVNFHSRNLKVSIESAEKVLNLHQLGERHHPFSIEARYHGWINLVISLIIGIIEAHFLPKDHGFLLNPSLHHFFNVLKC